MPRAPLAPQQLYSVNGRPMGRPRKRPPRNAMEVIEKSAATGATLTGIAQACGCCLEIFQRWLDEFPEFRQAINRGREAERNALHGKLYQAAMRGNIIAGMFLLKARHGYREGDQGETANRVQVVFQLPGALKTTEYIDANDPTQRLPAPGPASS